jgi:hypothetical protein
MLREDHIHPPSHGVPRDLIRGGRFVDAHVHLKEFCRLNAITDAGVVAVRDAGWEGNALHGLNPILRDNGLPLIISARQALYKKGGYGALFGMPVEAPEEIKSAIHLLKNAGADIIKVMASGMVSFKEPGRVTAGGFSREELLFIVQEAATCGLRVMAHANGEHAIIDAAEAGVRSIEHGFFMSRRALEVMEKRSTFWVPTVGALKRAAGSGAESREMSDFVDGLIRSHLEMIRYAHDIDLPLAIGTDCALPDPRYAEAYGAELAYFEQAGVPRGEVMKIASECGADLLGI